MEKKKRAEVEDPIEYRDKKDPQVISARKRAQEELPSFKASLILNSGKKGYSYFIKTDFVEKGEHEHMWVRINELELDGFHGTLENTPQIIKKLKFGDKVIVKEKNVEDYLFSDGKKNYGGYSVKKVG